MTRLLLMTLRQAGVFLYRAIGTAVAIGIMELLANYVAEPLWRIPFVTSIVLVTALPDSEASRPYAVIAGHMWSCGAGLVALPLLGPGNLASAVASGARCSWDVGHTRSASARGNRRLPDYRECAIAGLGCEPRTDRQFAAGALFASLVGGRAHDLSKGSIGVGRTRDERERLIGNQVDPCEGARQPRQLGWLRRAHRRLVEVSGRRPTGCGDDVTGMPARSRFDRACRYGRLRVRHSRCASKPNPTGISAACRAPIASMRTARHIGQAQEPTMQQRQVKDAAAPRRDRSLPAAPQS